MAQVDDLELPGAGDQYRALLQLRLILFGRGMRSNSGKVSSILRLLLQLLTVVFGLFWGVGAGIVTYWVVSNGQIALGQSLLIGFTVIWQMVVLLRSTAQHEVGRTLLRFPLRFRTYVTLWTLSGLLGFTTLAGALICIGIFLGASVAGTPYFVALIVGALLFLFNFTLSRVASAYLERLMAHRRTREFFLIVFSFIGLMPQFFRMYGGSVMHYIPAPVRRAAAYTPPPMLLRGLLLDASARQRWSGIAMTFAITAALSVLLLNRLRQEYRGEDLHEAVTGVREKTKVKAQYTENRSALSESVVLAVFANEISKLRHSGTAIYQTVAPLLFVVLFGFRMAARMPSMLLPAGVMYLSLGLVQRTGNSMGDDGAGAQLYSLAPVRFRDVMLGKNLYALTMFAAQLLVLLAISLFVGVPKFWYAAYALMFAFFAVAVNLWVGNINSLKSATKVDFSKMNIQSMRAQRRATGARASWRSLLMIFAVPGIGAGVGISGLWLGTPWLPSVIMLVLAAVAGALYVSRLSRFDHMTAADMEPALAALTKTA